MMACLMGASVPVESSTVPSGRTPEVPMKAMSALSWDRACWVREPTIDR